MIGVIVMVINTRFIAFRLFNIIQVQFQLLDTVFTLQIVVHEMLVSLRTGAMIQQFFNDFIQI